MLENKVALLWRQGSFDGMWAKSSGMMAGLGFAALLAGCGDYVAPQGHNGWVWTEPGGMMCRDGSASGYGYNKAPGGSANTLFMLQGGGACFNPLTCLENQEYYGRDEFVARTAIPGDSTDHFSLNGGAFDRTMTSNPFKDWNLVWIPYCTGDVFLGNKMGGLVEGWIEGPQMFVGWNNVSIAVPDAISILGQQSRVVFSGFSAGGFGASGNGLRISEMVSPASVDILDDSGPPMTDHYVAPCLQKNMWNLWAMDTTLGAICETCSENEFVMPLGVKLVEDAAKRGRYLGLIDSQQDKTIRRFYGFGKDNCQTAIPEMSGATYQAGLQEGIEILTLTADNAGSPPAFQSFVITGDAHTSIEYHDFYTRSTDGVSMVEWTADFLNGTGGHVWPSE